MHLRRARGSRRNSLLWISPEVLTVSDARRLAAKSSSCVALASHVGYSTFFCHGRVAESGLRHSTRNRAWGNPPWVRIPPLPPSKTLCVSRRLFDLGTLPELPLPVFSPQLPRRTKNAQSLGLI